MVAGGRDRLIVQLGGRPPEVELYSSGGVCLLSSLAPRVAMQGTDFRIGASQDGDARQERREH